MATALPLCLSFHPVKPAKKKKGNAKSVVCQKVSLISRFTIESQRKVRRRGVCVCVCEETHRLAAHAHTPEPCNLTQPVIQILISVLYSCYPATM